MRRQGQKKTTGGDFQKIINISNGRLNGKVHMFIKRRGKEDNDLFFNRLSGRRLLRLAYARATGDVKAWIKTKRK